MLVTSGHGACETESDQLGVAFELLAKQGMHSQVRSTLVRMMALFAATHCFVTSSSEAVEHRHELRLILQRNLAECMVGTRHTVGSLLCLSMC